MVHVDSIRRQFGARVLFDGLSWMIPKGARLGLAGPNGAGKTTLLRILAGLDAADGGQVRRPQGLRIGYLPQEVEAFVSGTVLAAVLEGFDELRRLDEKLADAEARLASLEPEDPALPAVTAEYGDLRHRFELLGGDRIESRARAILTGLGVAPSSFTEPLSRLSGGWRMRVVLARLLLGTPDLLLLDEPTNHLDLRALDWLESFLESFEGAFVVVSHDRYFLNRTVRGIVELERGRLTVFPGNYDDYLAEREAREEAIAKAEKLQAAEIARVERFVERFRYKATKARQVQSRLKALEKIERIHAGSRARGIRFGFPPAPRSGDIVARGIGLTKRYGATVVYDQADFVLRRGDRVTLVGPNGAGKSTLLKLLDGRLAPDSGRIDLGHNVFVEYYAQHQLEALDPASTVIEEMEKRTEPGARARLRGVLGAFLFSGEDIHKKVAVLSGGEKARLALARMLIRPSNLLLLDEPTNHLDLASREVLEEALNEYEGTLVMISHDRYFINRTTTAIGEVGGGRVEIYAGDYDTHLERTPRSAAEAAPETAASDEADPRQRGRDAKRREAEERNRRYRERRALEECLRPIEVEIETLEARLQELTTLQADPAVFREPERARGLARERSEAEARVRDLYARWDEVAGGRS